MKHRRITLRLWHAPLLSALLLVPSIAAHAQHAPAPSGHAAPTGTMDSGAMPGMDHGTMSGMDHGTMPGMDQGTTPGMQHENADHATHGGSQGTAPMPGAAMPPMQGGNAPAGARSPDYSDGVGYGHMPGMDMHDAQPLAMLRIDQLEVFRGRDANGQRWNAQGWWGNDLNKLWVRTEGERSGGQLEDADVELLWNRSIAAFWSSQLGVRHDFGEGPQRNWAAFGVQGLAPYGFEVEATGYVGAGGRTAARLHTEVELLFTQRLILEPEAEVNLYGKDDPERRIGSGVSDLQLGLRLRYEVHRQFAPYIGVNWVRRFGATADYARQDGRSVFDQQIVAGVRVWF